VYRVFKGWFESEQPFVGYGSSLAQDHDDLVALSPSADKDFLTRSLQDLAGRYMPVNHPSNPRIIGRGELNIAMLRARVQGTAHPRR
jgi:hypothetical protein